MLKNFKSCPSRVPGEPPVIDYTTHELFIIELRDPFDLGLENLWDGILLF